MQLPWEHDIQDCKIALFVIMHARGAYCSKQSMGEGRQCILMILGDLIMGAWVMRLGGLGSKKAGRVAPACLPNLLLDRWAEAGND